MKKILLILIFIPLVSFGQKKEKNPVLPMGDGVYLVGVSGNGNGRFKSLGKLRTIAFDKANSFAKKNNAIAEVISINETPMSFGVFNQVDLKFKLVSNTKKLSNPNSKSTILSVASSGNGNVTQAQLYNKDPKQDAIEELKKIKELFDLELITKEEFDNKAKELKKMILGN